MNNTQEHCNSDINMNSSSENNELEKNKQLVFVVPAETPATRIDNVEQFMEEESPQFRPAEEAEFLNKSTKSIPISVAPSVLHTPQSIASGSKQKHVSYEITPDKLHLPSTKENYVVDDLSSTDETDNEEAPKKDIPKWAQS